jgi:hypothetical protein
LPALDGALAVEQIRAIRPKRKSTVIQKPNCELHGQFFGLGCCCTRYAIVEYWPRYDPRGKRSADCR